MPQTQRLPSEFEAIAILVEKIKHPQWSLEKLASKLKAKNLYIEPHVIENLFLHHGLVIKKNHI
jgi:DNA-binding transcriptional regulator WhiA